MKAAVAPGFAAAIVLVGQAAEFAASLSAARSVRTIIHDRASGGGEHCQMGAQSLWHADFFDWVTDIDPAPMSQKMVSD